MLEDTPSPQSPPVSATSPPAAMARNRSGIRHARTSSEPTGAVVDAPGVTMPRTPKRDVPVPSDPVHSMDSIPESVAGAEAAKRGHSVDSPASSGLGPRVYSVNVGEVGHMDDPGDPGSADGSGLRTGAGDGDGVVLGQDCAQSPEGSPVRTSTRAERRRRRARGKAPPTYGAELLERGDSDEGDGSLSSDDASSSGGSTYATSSIALSVWRNDSDGSMVHTGEVQPPPLWSNGSTRPAAADSASSGAVDAATAPSSSSSASASSLASSSSSSRPGVRSERARSPPRPTVAIPALATGHTPPAASPAGARRADQCPQNGAARASAGASAPGPSRHSEGGGAPRPGDAGEEEGRAKGPGGVGHVGEVKRQSGSRGGGGDEGGGADTIRAREEEGVEEDGVVVEEEERPMPADESRGGGAAAAAPATEHGATVPSSNVDGAGEAGLAVENPVSTPTSSSRPPSTPTVDRFGVAAGDSRARLWDSESSRARKKRQFLENSRLQKWRTMLADWERMTTRHPALVRRRVRKGVPDAVRGMVWPLLVPACDDRAGQSGGVPPNTAAAMAAAAVAAVGGSGRLGRGSGHRSARAGAAKGTERQGRPASERLRGTAGDGGVPDLPRSRGECEMVYRELLLRASEEQAQEQAEVTRRQATVDPSSGEYVAPTAGEIIRRDVPRTFPHLEQFAEAGGQGQRQLRDVLLAYATLDKEVGYCQGMNFFTALLLCYMPEEDAFWVLVRLMQGSLHCMRSLYDQGLIALHRCLFQLRGLIRAKLPKLHHHFAAEDLDCAWFASEWFVTIYARSFPLELVVRVWDVFLLEGWKVVFRVALALLHIIQPQLMGQSMEAMMETIRELPATVRFISAGAARTHDLNPPSLSAQVEADHVFRVAFKLTLRRRELEDLAREFDMQQQQAQQARAQQQQEKLEREKEQEQEQRQGQK